MCSSDIFLGLIAILFPPLAVWVKRGICSADSLINILLCCLGFLPGLLHAWYIIAKFPEPEYEAVSQEENGRVTYVYVAGHQQRQPKPNGGRLMNAAPAQGYGTNAPVQAPAVGQNSNGTWQQAGEGSSAAPPPTYSQAVGDHKVQTRD